MFNRLEKIYGYLSPSLTPTNGIRLQFGRFPNDMDSQDSAGSPLRVARSVALSSEFKMGVWWLRPGLDSRRQSISTTMAKDGESMTWFMNFLIDFSLYSIAYFHGNFNGRRGRRWRFAICVRSSVALGTPRMTIFQKNRMSLNPSFIHTWRAFTLFGGWRILPAGC